MTTSAADRRRVAIERHDQEITDRLQQAQQRIAAAEAEVDAAKQERHGVICEAQEAHWSHARIGVALGVSKQRVSQILRAGGE